MNATLLPTIRGVIKRRILVNFRADADALARVVPPPFRPKLVRGVGMVGICLIALRHIRPAAVPWNIGLASENAAHRIAVEWFDDGKLCEGVYIPRRDTSSRLQCIAGGRCFPGVHHHSAFHVFECETAVKLRMQAADGTRIRVAGKVAAELPSNSIFESLEEASEFFRRGSVGYSVANRPGHYDGIELQSKHWHVTPLTIQIAESNYFSDVLNLPKNSLEFDCALLMRNIDHKWHARRPLHNLKPEEHHECCV